MIKNMSSSKKPKLAVVRAFPRSPEFEFYADFDKFHVKLIGNDALITKKFLKKNRDVESIFLNLKPKYAIDPIKLFFGKTSHRSWSYLDSLEEHLHDCDLIDISDLYFFYSRQCAELAKQLKIPLVAVVWETMASHYAKVIPPYSFNIQNVIGTASKFILRSQRSLQFTNSLGIPREKTKQIYKGVDTLKFHPAAKNRSNNQTINILYVGQLDKTKGVDDLLDVFVRLSGEYDNIELSIAGDGVLSSKIDKLKKNYRIKSYGWVDYSHLPDIYRQADIFCSPSIDLRYFGVKFGEERFSYTLMEAQASGLPIVSTYCGGIPEEVGTQNLLVNQSNPEELYSALKKYINNRDLRINTGKFNRLRAEKYFDLKKQVQTTQEFLLSVLP